MSDRLSNDLPLVVGSLTFRSGVRRILWFGDSRSTPSTLPSPSPKLALRLGIATAEDARVLLSIAEARTALGIATADDARVLSLAGKMDTDPDTDINADFRGLLDDIVAFDATVTRITAGLGSDGNDR